MPLSKLGELIGLEKMEMPTQPETTLQIIPYVRRETRIIQIAMKHLKNLLKDNGFNIRRHITISQIAMSAMLYSVRATGEHPQLFFNKDFNRVYPTQNADLIHKAYRYGRIEAFDTGTFNNVNYVDINDYPIVTGKRCTKRCLYCTGL